MGRGKGLGLGQNKVSTATFQFDEVEEGPIDLSPEELPSEIEDELLTKLIDQAIERRYEEGLDDEGLDDGDVDEEADDDGEDLDTGRTISVLSILQAAEGEDEEVREELLALLRSFRHGAIVTTGQDYRGCGYYFVRNTNYPEHEFDPQQPEDWAALELVPPIGEYGYGLPPFLGDSPYVMNYSHPQDHVVLDCTVDPSTLSEPMAKARALILKSIRDKPEVVSGYGAIAKRIVGYAKDDLNSHASCLLLISVPLDLEDVNVLPDYFFGEHYIYIRPPQQPRAKSAAQN
jgi:hypothetical protein